MSPAETARVLAKCQAYDRRTVGQADIAAWHEALADIDLQPALDAVAAWYAEHREFAMPADIRRLAKPVTPAYWRPLPPLPPGPADPTVGQRGIAACREALTAARTRKAAS